MVGNIARSPAVVPYVPSEQNAEPAIRLEVWTDIACPWCYIGSARLARALAQFPQRDRVEVRWRAYELSADTEAGTGQRVLDAMLARGMTAEQTQNMFGQVVDVAAADGLDIAIDTTLASNTFDAHRLVHLAGADTERGAQMIDALYRAHFAEGVAVDSRQELARIAGAVGLDADEVAAALASGVAADAVRADEKLAAELGVTGVPFFVANRKYAVSGAQPVELLLQMLQTALEN